MMMLKGNNDRYYKRQFNTKKQQAVAKVQKEEIAKELIENANHFNKEEKNAVESERTAWN